MTSRISSPALLEPYLGLPEEAALVVITGVLGASTNWLVLRYLHSLLKPAPQARPPPPAPTGGADDTTTTGHHFPGEPRTEQDGGGEGEVCVLLVSFLRDFRFWKESAGRLGLDLDGLVRRGRLGFVDGLSGLFSPVTAAAVIHSGDRTAQSGGVSATLTSPLIADVGRVLQAAVDELQAKAAAALSDSGTGNVKPRVVLVVDQLDFLLAARAESSASGQDIQNVLLDLREKIHATILTLSADEPLVISQTTGLEKEHAAFILSLAHEAWAVLSLRLLDTGVAKDVSGVVRITPGGDGSGKKVDEKEFLYHVGGDGGVRVFERGQ
ncbi:hypothetical protein B0T24DRAFT_422530 [Lasiosphaeria ovina]|uniref:Uncharacterized protein n=1 Tax=Lasiosphaeria ovina TaxID=92902 RepID=A0AAE0MZA1_9PEZI|nr:hypothetical protein B0T24DRAFT_422530 [Lasiosphaeria ovina]